MAAGLVIFKNNSTCATLGLFGAAWTVDYTWTLFSTGLEVTEAGAAPGGQITFDPGTQVGFAGFNNGNSVLLRIRNSGGAAVYSSPFQTLADNTTITFIWAGEGVAACVGSNRRRSSTF